MNIRKSVYFFLLLLLCTNILQRQAISQPETTRLTEQQLYRVAFSSKLDPIAINTMHAWVVHIENKAGQPVVNAEVAVVGGMPEHNHGLPTQPRITQNLGDGNYLLEGMKFHMGGWWQVTLSIHEANINDSVTFDLHL